MPEEKEEKKKTVSKTPTKNSQPKKQSAPKTKTEPKKEKTAGNNEPVPEKRKKIEIDLTRDFNESSTFDIEYYREIFMELRKQMDELSLRREKNDAAYKEYDDAVYNITANAVSDCSAQDFLGYCYKKGFYDFCIMNYEKYMKWTLLAAKNGNAFSISKLQVYLTSALDSIENVDHSVLLDFLDVTDDNYILFLSQLLCIEIVKILNISPEELVKMPEKFMEQNEEIQKVFDKAKLAAAENVQTMLQNAAKILNDELERQEELRKEEQELLKATREQEEQEQKQEEEKRAEVEPETKKEDSNQFKRKPGIKKKFRY